MRFLIVCLCLVCTACNMNHKGEEPAKQGELPAAISALQEALNSHNYSQIESFLDVEYQVPGVPANLAGPVLQQVVESYPYHIDTITIQSKEHGDKNTTYQVEFESGDSKRKHTLILSPNGHFVEIDIFRTQSQQPKEPQMQESTLPVQMTAPFILANNLMLTEATVNDTTGYFLVDSGAPSLILNSRYFISAENISVAGMGVSGAITNSSVYPVQEFAWGSYILRDFQAITMDISHIESALGKPISGLISQQQLQPFQVIFDYQNQEITLLQLDDQGTILADASNAKPREVISFSMAAHLPVISCMYQNKILKMALDTGAEVNLLDDNLMENIVFEDVQTDTLSGASKERTEIQSGNLRGFQVGMQTYDTMRFLASDISHLTTATNEHIDGLIGYQFLSRQKTAINYIKRELYILE